MSRIPTPAEIAAAVELACRLEADAPKPGNVQPGRPFGDMSHRDFVVSGAAIAPVLAHAGDRPLGETILSAVDATRRVTAANTNLGIILLMAPLTKGALASATSLRAGVRRVLAATTVADAEQSYAAIRLAGAGGMGSSGTQDLSGAPTVNLLEAMRLAADRDAIAGEYATGFAITFGETLPSLRQARRDGLEWPDAVVESYLAVLAARPDTLIGRKLGAAAAAAVSEQALAVQLAGGVRTGHGRTMIAAFDASLSDPHNSRNPGTTADLVAAGILALLLADGLN
ncbi:MAG: triphosphoribosyl-dephospho-CoA synthase [Gemmatimonadota bacterium]